MKTRAAILTGSLVTLAVLLMVPFRDAEAGHHVKVAISGSVVVSTAAPPVVVTAPPPVVVKPLPPPPPPVVVQPAPVVAVTHYQPVALLAPGPPPFEREVGLGLRIDGGIHSHEYKNEGGLGGMGLLLRMRLKPHFGMEIGADVLGGKGYAGAERMEIPATLNLLWYPGKHWSKVQFYFLTGFGAVWARVGDNPHADHPFYLGGNLGLGLEFRLGRSLALFTDIRGFLRHRMNERPDDPQVPSDGSCKASGECTDWEGGGLWTVGLMLYF